MARFNEILVGRFNRALQKFTGIKGEAPAPQLASEIMPVAPIPLGAEFRYLESWDRFFSYVLAPAGAAANSIVRLRNPVGQNVIAVLEKITVVNNNQGVTAALGPFTADLATIVNPGRMDARGRFRSALILSTAAGTPAGVATLWSSVPGANGVTEVIASDIQEIQLLPGDIFEAYGNGLNTAQAFVLWWRERYLEESERA
jgi:hypothetical protein